MNRFQDGGRRALWSVAALVLAFVVAGGGISLGRLAAAQEVTPTAQPTIEPGVVEVEPSMLACAAVGNAPAPTAAASEAPAATFSIVSEDSEARYRAQEELAGRGATEAVGKTNAFIGQILFDDSGLPLACSRFDVDLRTLQSDEARRDNYLYENTLETQQYPLATFVLTEVQGLDEPLSDDDQTTFTLIGNLTVHGVTRLVAWEATATLDGDTLEGSAATEFEMPDFDIEPPVVGPVLSLDETVKLEVDITAERAD